MNTRTNIEKEIKHSLNDFLDSISLGEREKNQDAKQRISFLKSYLGSFQDDEAVHLVRHSSIKKMKSFCVLMVVLALFCACSFKGQKDQSSSFHNELSTRDNDPDLDGDGISNEAEKARGTSPFVADIPEMKIRFLQNYKIKVDYKTIADNKSGSFEINTKVRESDPDFKYRVGDIFIRNESRTLAAKSGRFSSHNTGKIAEHDLSWVNYPDVDPRIFTKWQSDFKKYLNHDVYEISNITITLENSAQLKPYEFVKGINNLALNFYYFDYEKENYELLKSQVVERHFNSGVNETFEVVIENVPVKLIEENFFKRGEFVISEVADYEIPEMQTTYKKLMESVKAKTLPVVFNTPLESEIYYVATGSNGIRFNDLLAKIFIENFKIEKDSLERVGQFTNNLSDFTYLKEISNQDKKGKWFILTNSINQSYLDYNFGPKDIVSISYITGDELAQQSKEKIVSFRNSAKSEEAGSVYSLGNVSPNSLIDVELTAIEHIGEKKIVKDGGWNVGGKCGKNCIQRDFSCSILVNTFQDFKESFNFSNDTGNELEQITLLINQNEFSLVDLIKAKKVISYLKDNRLHLVIKNIGLIKEIHEVEENVIALKLNESKETVFNGVKLLPWSGPDARFFCPDFAINVAGSNKIPLSNESFQFSSWRQSANWNVVKLGETKTIRRNITLSIASVVNNFYN